MKTSEFQHVCDKWLCIVSVVFQDQQTLKETPGGACNAYIAKHILNKAVFDSAQRPPSIVADRLIVSRHETEGRIATSIMERKGWRPGAKNSREMHLPRGRHQLPVVVGNVLFELFVLVKQVVVAIVVDLYQSQSALFDAVSAQAHTFEDPADQPILHSAMLSAPK